MTPVRGDIWEVDLDPTVGHEQAKRRPCVVISIDVINKREMSVVVPLSSQGLFTKSGKLIQMCVEVQASKGTGLLNVSYALSNQVRTVSHDRFGKKFGEVDSYTLLNIVSSVMLVIGAA